MLRTPWGGLPLEAEEVAAFLRLLVLVAAFLGVVFLARAAVFLVRLAAGGAALTGGGVFLTAVLVFLAAAGLLTRGDDTVAS